MPRHNSLSKYYIFLNVVQILISEVDMTKFAKKKTPKNMLIWKNFSVGYGILSKVL
jgi:hypothetical protein